MKELSGLTDLQLQVLEVLWARRRATATEVHAHLEADLGLSRKTIGTVLHRLEKQGIVGHEEGEGREYVYAARVSKAAVSRSKLESLRERLFGGRTPELISFALSEGEVAPGDVAKLRALLEEWEEQ